MPVSFSGESGCVSLDCITLNHCPWAINTLFRANQKPQQSQRYIARLIALGQR